MSTDGRQKLNYFAFGSAIAGSAALTILLNGCGGGGGGGTSPSSRPPYAGEPVCNNAIRQQPEGKPGIVGANSPRVFVPETSIELPSDVGQRVHTNHLISLATAHPAIGGVGGLAPSQIATAYGLSNYLSGGAGAIAIVDAYNYPTSLNDFNEFSNNYGLRTETSTNATASSNATFQVVYANGKAPTNDGGWSQEMAIDIEWAHAMAPMAKIYLVEAASSNFTDVMSAVNVAKRLPGVREVSTSFGGTEIACFYVQYDGAFVQPGVSFFAAAGDTAAVRNYPALSSNVVAVGGTTLSVGPTGNWIEETVWSDTGCGPSAYEPRPVFQDPFYSTIGLYRGGSDIVAVADPNTGVAVYDSYAYGGFSGWFVAGGTSVACPIVAGIVNNSGLTFASTQALCKQMYSLSGSGSFHAITSGAAGSYRAGSPWSFATGLGSPNGVGSGL